MKKILFVIGSGIYPNIVGGMEIFNYYLIQNLIPYYQIYYIATNKYNYSGAHFFKEFKIRPTKFLSPLQVLIRLLLHPSIKTFILSFSKAHWAVWYLYYLISKLLKRKYIVIIHYGQVPPKGKYKIYKKFFDSANYVISVSKDIKDNYETKFGIKSSVIYPLVPFKTSSIPSKELRVYYRIPQNANLICMVGSLKEMKNPDTIISVLNLFSEEELKNFNPYIIFAGDGNFRSYLEDLCNTYKLKDRITFLGFVPKEDINQIMKISDIYLISSDFEGTSVSLLEAMYNKKAIIASRVPGIINTVTENVDCLMFEKRNIHDLKLKLLRLLSDKSLSKCLSDNAYNSFMENFNYENIINSYRNIL